MLTRSKIHRNPLTKKGLTKTNKKLTRKTRKQSTNKKNKNNDLLMVIKKKKRVTFGKYKSKEKKHNDTTLKSLLKMNHTIPYSVLLVSSEVVTTRRRSPRLSQLKPKEKTRVNGMRAAYEFTQPYVQPNEPRNLNDTHEQSESECLLENSKIRVLACEEEVKSFVQKFGDKTIVMQYFLWYCPPCKMLCGKLEEWAEAHPNVIFVKVDALKAKNNFSGFPHTLIWKKGKIAGEVSGFDPEAIRKHF
jgi:thiol-disulfide isomerase/thioredoxin